MPRLLSPCDMEVVSVCTLQPQDMLLNEERKEMEEGTAPDIEMDFFTDEYHSLRAGSTHTHSSVPIAISKGKGAKWEGEGTGAPQGGVAADRAKVVDCDVSLQLRHAGRRDGHSVGHTVRIPAAVSLFPLMREAGHVANGSTTCLRLQTGAGFGRRKSDERFPDAGAAWEGEEPNLTTGLDGRETFGSEGGAAVPFCGNVYSFDREPMGSKSTLAGMEISQHAHLMGDSVLPFVGRTRNGSESVPRGPPFCSLRLPADFVLGLRLPSDVEQQLVESYNTGVLTSAGGRLTKVPEWLIAFLYTPVVRRQLSTAVEIGSAQVATNDGFCVSVLEGFCIAALHVVSQMGNMRLHAMRQQVDVSELTAIEEAQRCLLGEGGLFAHTQKEQIKWWLQRYIPQEAYTSMENEGFLWRNTDAKTLQPSAVAVVCHIAVGLARSLFPCVFSGLESTILIALQPLLGVRTLNMEATWRAELQLLQPPTRRNAIVLLTQSPVAWWCWWHQGDFNHHNNGSLGNGEREHVPFSFPHRCSNVIAASRGYGAMRVLNLFATFDVNQITDDTQHVGEAAEVCEVAQFLLSAPTLFCDLLLDREVAGVLERTSSEVGQLIHKTMRGFSNDLAFLGPSHPRRILTRCFVVLICWLAFRPSGYCRMLARTYFACILRHTSSLYEQVKGEGASSSAFDADNETWSTLVACVYDHFLKVASLLHAVRGFGRLRRGRRQQMDLAYASPCRPLRCAEESCAFLKEDDGQATQTSYSHTSANSLRSTHTLRSATAVPARGFIPHDAPSATPGGESAFPCHSLRLLRHVLRSVRGALRLLKCDVLGADVCEEVCDPVPGLKRFRDECAVGTSEEVDSHHGQPHDGRKRLRNGALQLVEFMGDWRPSSQYVGCTMWSASSEDENEDGTIKFASTTTTTTTSESDLGNESNGHEGMH